MARRFVCNKPAAHQIYALSLHDALPVTLAPIGLAMYDHWDRSPVSKSACHNSSACAPVLNSIKPAKTVVGSAEIMVGLLCARVSITVNNLVPPAGKIMGGSAC